MKRTAVALIDEARCIGCVRCIEACPVDAIAGARGYLHTVIADYCTGCELCLPPCPVDCIGLVPPPAPWRESDARAAKIRAMRKKERNSRQVAGTAAIDRKAVIAAALKRKARR